MSDNSKIPESIRSDYDAMFSTHQYQIKKITEHYNNSIDFWLCFVALMKPDLLDDFENRYFLPVAFEVAKEKGWCVDFWYYQFANCNNLGDPFLLSVLRKLEEMREERRMSHLSESLWVEAKSKYAGSAHARMALHKRMKEIGMIGEQGR